MADIKTAYQASVEIDIDPESLASSASRTAGVEGTAIVNTATRLRVAQVGGKIRTGTSPTAGKQIDVWAYAAYKDTPTYPDGLLGSKGARTITSENIRNAVLKHGALMIVDATSDRDYYFQFEVAELFGYAMPTHWGIFIAHDTAVNLNATGTNHTVWYTGTYETVG